MTLIPPFFLNCVVSIGLPSPQGAVEQIWIGTGFIVGRRYTGEDAGDKVLYHTFLVTNKHVIENKKNIIVRFNPLEGKDTIDYPVDLEENNDPIWVGHDEPSIDVACFFINSNVLNKDKAEFGYFKLDEHAIDIDGMKNEGVSEGDGVFVLGFPMGIVTPERNYVIARMGSIARVRDTLAEDSKPFLIDANIFPGNSGGPVVIRPELTSIQGTKAINKAALIGIVKSYVPYRDVAISQQTGNARVIFEENSGLASVESVNTILKTVEKCFDTKLQKGPNKPI